MDSAFLSVRLLRTKMGALHTCHHSQVAQLAAINSESRKLIWPSFNVSMCSSFNTHFMVYREWSHVPLWNSVDCALDGLALLANQQEVLEGIICFRKVFVCASICIECGLFTKEYSFNSTLLYSFTGLLLTHLLSPRFSSAVMTVWRAIWIFPSLQNLREFHTQQLRETQIWS